MTCDFIGRLVILSAPGPQATENGVHDGPGAVLFARPQVGVVPQRDDGGRVAEDQLDLRATGLRPWRGGQPHADCVLADPAWPALATSLARAETAGHNPRRLLAEVAAQRELDTAERPAEVPN